jgi:SAM-dependent methyltransferase
VLLRNAGFVDIKVHSFANTYPLRYWIRLLPVPSVRNFMHGICARMGLLDKHLTLPVGNMVAMGTKLKEKTMKTQKHNVDVFSRDVLCGGGGYAYTGERLSSILANRRITEAYAALYPMKGKRLLDLGCGDGTYSLELLRLGANFVVGIDPSEAAVAVASKKADQTAFTDRVHFQVGNIYNLSLNEHFDCIILRGVLHHLPDAAKALKSISSFSDNVLIMEPNGANPVLKLIEKTSKYHIEHEEQSFLFSTIHRWLYEAGYIHCSLKLVNLVPMFCPDWMARLCKLSEPVVESLPFIRNVCCGQYIILATKINGGHLL